MPVRDWGKQFAKESDRQVDTEKEPNDATLSIVETAELGTLHAWFPELKVTLFLHFLNC